MPHTEDDLHAFVGPNADYYLSAWSKAGPQDAPQSLRWNWPAFFLNFLWLLYRRMYKYFFIAFAVLLALGAVQAVVEMALDTKAPLWVAVVLNFAVCCWFGAFGTWLYYRHADWKISQVKAHHTSTEAIVRAGGVQWLWPVLLFVVPVILGILAAIMIPQLKK